MSIILNKETFNPLIAKKTAFEFYKHNHYLYFCAICRGKSYEMLIS